MFGLYENFQESLLEICKEFHLNPKNIEYKERIETPGIGVTYIAEIKEKDLLFEFSVDTFSEKPDPTDGLVDPSIRIEYKDEREPYHEKGDIQMQGIANSDLVYWVQCASYKHNTKIDPINLENLFRGKDIKVYGYPDLSRPTNDEFLIFITGISILLPNTKEKLIVYRFRHLNEKYHFLYSYAFFVPGNLWVFFPKAVSGGGDIDFKLFENQIEKKRKCEKSRKFIDVNYSELEKFLMDREIRFRSSLRSGNIPFPDVCYGLEDACKEYFLNKQYPDSIFAATKILENTIKEISGIKNKIGVQLVRQVFNEERPILNISPGDTKKDISERMGFKLILEGVFTGIKNLGSHSFPQLDDGFIASEYLVFFDLLLNRIYNSQKENLNGNLT